MAYNFTQTDDPFTAILQGLIAGRAAKEGRQESARQRMLDELKMRLQQAEEERQGRVAEAQIANYAADNQRLAEQTRQTGIESALKGVGYGGWTPGSQGEFMQFGATPLTPEAIRGRFATMTGPTAEPTFGPPSPGQTPNLLPLGAGIPALAPMLPYTMERRPGWTPTLQSTEDKRVLAEARAAETYAGVQDKANRELGDISTAIGRGYVKPTQRGSVRARVQAINRTLKQPDRVDPEAWLNDQMGPVAEAQVEEMRDRGKLMRSQSAYYDERTRLLDDQLDATIKGIESRERIATANRTSREGISAAGRGISLKRVEMQIGYQAKKDSANFLRLSADDIQDQITALSKLKMSNRGYVYLDNRQKQVYVPADANINKYVDNQLPILEKGLAAKQKALGQINPANPFNIPGVTVNVGGTPAPGGGTVTVPPPVAVDTSEVSNGLQGYAKTDGPGQGARRTKQTINFLVSKGLSPAQAKTKATELMGSYYWKAYQARRKAKK